MPPKRSGPPTDLFPAIYGELRRVARGYLSRERANHTLQPTALVHEAWLRLQNERGGGDWHGRTHGLALGAQAMRRLLIDHGRKRRRDKRGGKQPHVDLDELLDAAPSKPVPIDDLIALDDALTQLEAVDARAAEIVTLRYFAGMTAPEVADHLELSLRTVESDWTHARAWLRRALSGGAA
jgi:RNA polymerase sigma factor (TIGR02999 family)